MDGRRLLDPFSRRGSHPQARESLVEGMGLIPYILGSLPHLFSLNLDGREVATSDEILLALIVDAPPLLSLVGLENSSLNYKAAVNVITSLSQTLQTLNLVYTTSMEEVVARNSHPTVELPNLLRLDVVPSNVDVLEDDRHPLGSGWHTPKLRSLSTGMASTEAFGEEGSSADLLFPADFPPP